jgi:cleavage and polyadenylation specificity factor subunit 3
VVSINDIVTVRYRPAAPLKGYGAHVVVEWEGGSQGDLLADAVIAVLLQAAEEPPAASAAEAARRAALQQGDAAGAAAAEMALAAELLKVQFGSVRVDVENGVLVVDLDGVECVVDAGLSKVSCADERLRQRVERVMQRVAEAMRPCTLDRED